jgi:hypothetical protein
VAVPVISVTDVKITEPLLEGCLMATPRWLTRLSVVAAATLVPGLVLAGPSLATETSDANCHPSYPSICIPLGSADVDCPELRDQGLQDFEVVEPDPHRLDRDNDGVGCETGDDEPTTEPTRDSDRDAVSDSTRDAKKDKPRVPKEIPAGL